MGSTPAPVLAPLVDCPWLIPLREETGRRCSSLSIILSPQGREGCPPSSAEVSHLAPDFFLFLMWFLSPVLSNEHRKSYRLPKYHERYVPGNSSWYYLGSPPLFSTGWEEGGHADGLEVTATGSKQLCRLTSPEN